MLLFLLARRSGVSNTWRWKKRQATARTRKGTGMYDTRYLPIHYLLVLRIISRHYITDDVYLAFAVRHATLQLSTYYMFQTVRYTKHMYLNTPPDAAPRAMLELRSKKNGGKKHTQKKNECVIFLVSPKRKLSMYMFCIVKTHLKYVARSVPPPTTPPSPHQQHT